MAKRRRVCYLVCEDLPAKSPATGVALRALSDLELVALLLGQSAAAEEPVARAARLLDGGPAAVLQRMSSRRIRTLAGAGGGARICAAIELGRRILQGTGCRVLSSPKHVLDYARAYAAVQKEHFLVIHLNARHLPRRLEVVSVGTLSASLVHPREVFREAINRKRSIDPILIRPRD